MQQIVLLIHVLVAIFVIVLVLIQHGKGADIGANFGGGASQTLFGSQGSGTFLMKVTFGLAAVFFITSLALGFMASQQVKDTDQVAVPVPPTQIITAPTVAPVVTQPAVNESHPIKKKIYPVKPKDKELDKE